MKKTVILSFFLLLLSTGISAQRTDYPLIGAQVFIEPGQTETEIDSLFGTLSRFGMEIARIRLFGSHIFHDGKEDFSLYDAAFDAASRHGVKLFVTLFPPTDELHDLGGFKHPSSTRQLEEVRSYIHKCVSHYAGHPALYAWVLQNEPGTGGMSVRKNELSAQIRREWDKENPQVPREGRYLREDFREYGFLRYYNTWYLDWIATEVRRIDPDHYLHVNPHQILHTLPEYDFRAYEDFLTSLGVSMHMSWHFGDFSRNDYALGVSMMADIIRERAASNPFWVTELQGGNVTFSGDVSFCPTSAEIQKYLWTNIAAGAQGVIFWTLNPRKAVLEAGEWALLDYQGEPSDRLSAAAQVQSCLKDNPERTAGAQVLSSALTILYNDNSLLAQKYLASSDSGAALARSSSGVLRSVISAYKAASSLGATPALVSMDYFDWNPDTHPAVVLPNMICIPQKFHESIKEYVKNGGKLLVTGLSGYYDEGLSCMFSGPQPFEECFGCRLSEVKSEDGQFFTKCFGCRLPSHLWRGIIKGSTSTVAAYNRYGEGEVWWIPSLVHLGAEVSGDYRPLVRLYSRLLGKEMKSSQAYFARPEADVLLRATRTGKALHCYLINLSGHKKRITLICCGKKMRVILPPDGVVVKDVE